jgi:hypothetical protein
LVLKVALPATGTPPGAATVKAASVVAAVIAMLKVALMAAPVMGTFVANGSGVTDATPGTFAAIVVNDHT